MPTPSASRAAPEKFRAIVTAEQVGTYFLYFLPWLETLGFSQSNAADAFLQDYGGAWCPWDDENIPKVFQRVALENKRKYDMACAIFAAEYEPLVNYDRTESEIDTRTPNLTTAHSGQNAVQEARATKNNQTEHRADKPKANDGETWQETTTRSVAPYNTTDFSGSEMEERTETGWRETETSYTGEADTENTTRNTTDASTVTETGTETHARSLTAKGNIGTMTVQDMANQELDLAERMNVFRAIERDLAAKLFLQVW